MGYTAIILAGGKSSRFGHDKTVLELNNERIIETIVKKCRKIFSEILIIGNSQNKFNIPDTRELSDIYTDMGPLGGIHAGLTSSSNEICFVAACDLPLFHLPLAIQLLNEANEYDAVIPRERKGVQPLFAVYKKSILPQVEKLLRENNRSVLSLHELVSVRYVEQETWQNKNLENVDIFYNINYIEDYQKIKGATTNMKTIEKFSVPTISVVGYSDSGKTTYLEKLIPVLKERGFRVCVVKHDAHSFEIDIPGKDSWRLAQAGADITMVSSPAKLAIVEKWTEQEGLESISSRLKSKVDLILTEGFKRGNAVKIEIRRSAIEHQPMCKPEELLAVASDYDSQEKSDTYEIPWLPLNDAEPMANLIAEYIKQFSAGLEESL